MRSHRNILRSLAALTLAALVSSCNEVPTGPSLANISVGPLSLASTAGDNNVCCCRVVGTVKNLNQVPVSATFTFTAFDADRTRPISKVLFFINDFRAGTERPIDAHGFVYPCAIIKDLATELDVRGLTAPPL